MADWRKIHRRFFSSKDTIRLSRDSRLTFVGAVVLSDDEGYLPGDPDTILAQLFPRDFTVTAANVRGWVAEFVTIGMAWAYVFAPDDVALFIPNFQEYNAIRSDRLRPSEIKKRVSRATWQPHGNHWLPTGQPVVAGWLPYDKTRLDKTDQKHSGPGSEVEPAGGPGIDVVGNPITIAKPGPNGFIIPPPKLDLGPSKAANPDPGPETRPGAGNAPTGHGAKRTGQNSKVSADWLRRGDLDEIRAAWLAVEPNPDPGPKWIQRVINQAKALDVDPRWLVGQCKGKENPRAYFETLVKVKAQPDHSGSSFWSWYNRPRAGIGAETVGAILNQAMAKAGKGDGR